MAERKKRRRLLTKRVDRNKVSNDQVLLAWRDLLNGRSGELVRDDLETEILTSSFDPNPVVMAYNEGKKDFARRILQAAELTKPPETRTNLTRED